MENLILYFGGRQQTADALGVKPSYISMCRHNKRKLGIDKILLAIKITNGKFSVDQLRQNNPAPPPPRHLRKLTNMATHPAKRMNTVSFKTTSEIVTALLGLSELEGVSPSEYIHNVIKETVDRRRIEVRLLSNALGINDD